MVTSRLENRAVWLVVEGPLLADEFIAETDKWLSRLGEYDGYITDARLMTTASALDKKRIEERRQRNRSGKLSAILVKDDFMGVAAKIYINFTKASDTQIFTDPGKAAAWIASRGGRT